MCRNNCVTQQQINVAELSSSGFQKVRHVTFQRRSHCPVIAAPQIHWWLAWIQSLSDYLHNETFIEVGKRLGHDDFLEVFLLLNNEAQAVVLDHRETKMFQLGRKLSLSHLSIHSLHIVGMVKRLQHIPL